MSKRKNRVTAKLVIAPNGILTKVCEPVKDGEDVTRITRDMRHILVNSETGVGLAAPQAGHLKRIIVAAMYGELYTMINPEIIDQSHDTDNHREWCLSYPNESKIIERFRWIEVNWLDDVYGEERNDVFAGFPARVIQHEIDHLDGKCKVGAV